MQYGRLPYLLPVSQGGIFALGISVACTITKLIPKSFPYKSLLLVGFLIVLFLIDALLSLNRLKCLSKMRFFLFGILLFFTLDANFGNSSHLDKESWKSEHSIHFSEVVSRLLSESHMPRELQAVAKGLVLGSSKYLPSEIKNRTREGGILHLFAASGLHLGIFIGFSLFVLKKIFRTLRPVPYLLALLLGFLYLYLLAFPVSFLRAYSFATYSLLGMLFYRKTLPADTLSYSSATVAILLPLDFLSVGFLLSFGAVLGIFYIKPILDFYFFEKWKHMIKDNITLSLACSFATFPTLVFYFHSFSFGSFWINLIVVPMATLLLPCLYLNIALQYFIGGILTSFIWKLSDFYLRVFLRIVEELTNEISYYFSWEKLPIPILVYFLLLLLLFQKKYFDSFFIHPLRKTSHPKSESNRRRYAMQLFFVFILLGFHPFGIWYLSFQERLESEFQSLIFKGNLFAKSETSFYMLGKCYSEAHFKKAESTLRTREIQSIYIEDESCLKHSLHLKKSIERQVGRIAEIIVSKSFSFLPILKKDKEKITFLIRYNGDKRTIQSLIHTLRNLEGKYKSSMLPSSNILLLDFPPWTKEKPEDWKKFQKLLGISSYWKIMSVEELLAKPLHDTDRDSELSFR